MSGDQGPLPLDRDLVGRIHDLVVRIQSATATAGDRAALDELVRDSSQARRTFRDYMNDTALLRWHNSGSPSDVARDLSEIAPGCERRALGRRGVGALAGMVLVGLMAAFLSAAFLPAARRGSDGEAPAVATGPRAPAATGVATVTRVDGVRWDSAAVVWPELSRLTVGDVLRFEAGEVSLVFDSGVEVTIRGPADFEVRATDRAFSRLGLITARVGRDGSGFTIETPVATVVDLGTEFVVGVSPSGSTDVAVFSGLVDLSIGAGQPTVPGPRRVTQGEALRIDESGRLDRIVSIASDRFPDARAARPPSVDPLILDVRDNRALGHTSKFYRVVRGGLREDALAYVDRNHEWNGVDARGLPPFLVGAEYVMPYNDDKFLVDLEVDIELARPAAIFVFLSDAMPVPDWLRRDFFDTGEKIGLDEARNRHVPSRRSGSGPGKSIDTVFSVWRRNVGEASTVTLGAPVQPEGVTGFNMYGIAAVPLVDPSLPSNPGTGTAP